MALSRVDWCVWKGRGEGILLVVVRRIILNNKRSEYHTFNKADHYLVGVEGLADGCPVGCVGRDEGCWEGSLVGSREGFDEGRLGFDDG